MDKPFGQVKPQDPLRLTAAHQKNNTSQCGEDGIIAAIFAHLQIVTGIAVEFGAWDGVRYSNTNALVDKGWRVVLIEGDPERFQALQKATSRQPNISAVNAWVAPTGESSLDAILTRLGITTFDFLSVDIDGDDYHILAKLAAQPKVICVEFNPTIPPPVALIGGLGKAEGSSVVAFDDLLSERGYTLVYATTLNAFFVSADIADHFVQTTPAEAFDYRSARFVISYFNGRNRIVDSSGKARKAKNQWSKARAAIPLNLPKASHMVACIALVCILGVVLYWWL